MYVCIAYFSPPDVGWLGVVAWILIMYWPFLRFLHTDWVYERWKTHMGPPIRLGHETIIDALAYAVFIALLAVDRIVRQRPIWWWWATTGAAAWLLIVVLLYLAYRTGALFESRTARDEEHFRERWLRRRGEQPPDMPESHDEDERIPPAADRG